MDIADLATELTDAGLAIGLLSAPDGGTLALNGDFFADPAGHVAKLVSDPHQRAALLDALDALVPTDPAEVGAAISHHRLVELGRGQLSLTVERSGTGAHARTAIGLAGEIHSQRADASVSVELPLVSAVDNTVTATAATTDAPLALRIRLPLPGGGSVVASLLFVASPLSDTRFAVRIEPAAGPAIELDPITLPDALGRLVASLLTSVFATLDPDAAPTVASLAEHLPAILGLSDGLPEFPFEDLASDGSVRGWIARLAQTQLADGRSALAAWLSHLGQLLGAPVPTTTLPTEADPLILQLTPDTAPVSVRLLVGVRDVPADRGQALVVTVHMGVPAVGTSAAVTGDGVLLVLPLSGLKPPTLLERLDLSVRAPADDTGMLYRSTSGPDIHVGSLRAGLRYDGTTVTPLLELVDVALADGGTFAKLDLTDTHTLATAARTALENAIRAGLGESAPLVDALFVLIGLDQTPGVDVGLLASAPTRAIADYYRRLRAVPDGWPRLVGAVSRLLGLPADQTPAIVGTGTRVDPWRVSLAHLPAPDGAAPILWLTMWDDGGGPDPRLRVGLRVEASTAADASVTWQLALDSEFLGADLSATGGSVHWFGAPALRVSASGLPSVALGPATMSVTGLTATLAWTPGASLAAEAVVQGLAVAIDGATVPLGDLRLPADRPVLDDPALGLGIAVDPLWTVIRLLLVRALDSWCGRPGVVLANLVGLGDPAALGLPADLPPLPLPIAGDLRSVLDDPIAALRAWLVLLTRADTGLATSGVPMLDALRGPLQALLTDNLPAAVSIGSDSEVPPPAGSGIWGDPWTVPLQPAGEAPVELLAWLDPDGPPADWANPARIAFGSPDLLGPDAADDGTGGDGTGGDGTGGGDGAAAAAVAAVADDPADPGDGTGDGGGDDGPDLPNDNWLAVPDIDVVVDAIVALRPYLDQANAIDPADRGTAIGQLSSLTDALHNTDGIVPIVAAVPVADGWALGQEVVCAHHQLPGDGDAIRQLRDQIAAWTAGMAPEDWAAVLLAPELAGTDPWQPYLGVAGVSDAQTVNLRVPGIEPANVDLAALASASHYVVQLADDGTAAVEDVADQLGRVIARIAAVRAGARVVVVAHSYAALSALQWVSRHPAGAVGLIALGAPLAPVEPLFGDAVTADGVRLVRRLAPDGLTTAPAFDAALAFLDTGLDGYRDDGLTKQAAPFPAAAFQRVPDTLPDLGGVPALAINANLVDDLVAALVDQVDRAAAGVGDPAPVTHVGYGLRIGLPLPAAADGDPAVSATLRVDLGSAKLVSDDIPPLQPVTRVLFTATSGDGSSWLLGSAGDGTTQSARVRAMEFAVGIGTEDNADDGVAGGATVRLFDAALNGSSAALIDLDDPRGVPLLAALVTALDAQAVAGGRLRAILDLLVDLGLLKQESPSGLSIVADALQSLLDDPADYLAPLLPALLDRPDGLLGVKGVGQDRPLTGPWRATPTSLPVELLIERDPWRMTVHTIDDGLHTAGDGRLVAAATVGFDDLSPTLSSHFSVVGLTLIRDEPGTVSVAAPWLDAPVQLFPADPAKLRSALAPLVPRLLLDAGLTTLLEQFLDDGAQLASLSTLLTRPADWLLRADAFGDGRLPRPDAVNELLSGLAEAAGLDSEDDQPLILPGGFVLAASPSGTGVRLGVSTPTVLDLGGLQIAIDGFVEVDSSRHAVPGGDVSIQVPLPAGAGWSSVGLRLGANPAGLSLAVDLPDGTTTTTIQLLPTVSGLADLVAAGAARLLPFALDTLVNALGDSPVRQAALNISTALKIYDPAGGFANPASQARLLSLAADLVNGRLAPTPGGLAAVVNQLLRLLLPGAAIPALAAGGTSVGVSIPGVLGGTVALAGDLGTVPPAVSLTAQGLTLGVAAADATLAFDGHAVTADAQITATIDTGQGVVLTPRLRAHRDADGATHVDLHPLGDDKLVVALAPQLITPSLAEVGQLAEHWVVPLMANAVVDALKSWLDTPLWTAAGITVRDLLVDVGLVDAHGHLVQVPPPSPAELALAGLRVLRALPIPLGEGLTLSIDEDTAAHLLGVRLAGRLTLTDGDQPLTVDFGLPAGVAVPWPGGDRGVTLFLLDSSAGTPTPTALLRLAGFGVGLSGKGDPLIDAPFLRLGGVSAYVRADLPFTGPDALHRPAALDGAVMLDQLGFPIGSGTSTNPVAASLLRRVPGDDGDRSSANPPFDLLIATVDGQFVVRFDGVAELELPVRESLGPLYVDALDLTYQSDPRPGIAGAGITGGVQVGPLNLGVRDLRVQVPVRSPGDLDTWGIDLGGLALQWDNGIVSLGGGLEKTVAADGTITYDGALSATVAGRRLAAVGSYAQLQNCSSLFVFLAYPFPLGGPPYFYVLGIAAGAGYNRRLTPPRDPAGVPSFPLVAALAGPSGSNPVAALAAISQDMPPRRGSYWIAAGVNFTTFGLLHGTALAYVALDRGTEVGLLGLMRLALPPDDDTALVSVELALAAHYSTVDQVLAVRAALTRNSWLISRDVQLTGGFALLAQLAKPDVLLTIGGYHPRFVRPADYPEVDRVGFRWDVGSGIVVKGESYLAIMHSGLMFGGSLEASYTASWIKLWFRAGLDVMLFWDPLRYQVDAFVSVGASVHIRVCFIFCVTIDLSVSIGARLSLDGPPLHGTVTVDLAVSSVTVSFGKSAPPPFLTWPEIQAKYLEGGETGRPVTNAVVTAGLRPGETGPVSVVAPVFTLRFESSMPSAAWRLAPDTVDRPSTVDAPAFVNAVPAGGHLKPLRGVLVLGVDRLSGDQWIPLTATELSTLVPTTRAASFPTSLWSTTPTDPQADQPPLARVDMLSALGGLDVAADSTTHEATGTLGDHAQLALATLVEEETPRPLPFLGVATAATAAPVAASVAPRAARAAVALGSAAGTAEPSAGPTLRSVTRAATPPAWRAAAPGPAALRPATTGPAAATPNGFAGTALPAGTTHLWDLPSPAAAAQLGVSGTGDVHAIALSATGAPLRLRHRPVGDGGVRRFPDAPDGTARLAVRHGSGPAGWDLSTSLLQVGSSTLLANAAVVLTAQPFRPPARYRAGVPAVLVTSSQPRLTTVLPGDCHEVLVHLDRRTQADGLGDLAVTYDPSILDGPEVVAAGDRTTLRYRVRGRADQISITVASATDWWLAGVTGTPADRTSADRAQADRAPADRAPAGVDAGIATISVLPAAQEATHG